MKSKRLKNNLLIFGASLLYLLLLFCSDAASQGFRSALWQCADAIVPTLFPLMAVTGVLCALPTTDVVCRLTERVLSPLFGVSGNAAPVFLFGASGGYVLGVRNAEALYASGALSKEEARRAALINVHPGIGFSVLLTGSSVFGSTKAGLLLYAAVTAGNLLTGLLFFCRKENLRSAGEQKKRAKERSAGQTNVSIALINAVKGAVTGVSVLCGWIVLFAAVSAVFEERIPFGPFRVLFEVTDGVRFCKNAGNLPLCAAALAFGGACIALQLFPALSRLGVRMRTYVLFRLLSGAFAGLFVFAFLKCFPEAIPVISGAIGGPLRKITLHRWQLTAALALMAATFMRSLSRPASRTRGTG